MEEYFGNGIIKVLTEILGQYKHPKIFLVTGKSSYEFIHSLIEPQLKGHHFIRFSDFKPNPVIEDICRGVSVFQEERCDFVIALGGGSVLDTAKLINLFSNNFENPLKYILKQKMFLRSGFPLVAIPTTAGSGSEATDFAVVYVNKHKYSVAHPYLLPNYCLVDPKLTFSMPPHLTAVTGLDAFSQAVESYWSVFSTEESKRYSEEALILTYPNLLKATYMPDLDARIAMARGSFLAGKAIKITKTTAPHALSYPFTAHFGIPHGQAVALSLGSVLEENSKINSENCQDFRGSEYVLKTIDDLCSLLDSDSPLEAKQKITTLIKELGLKNDIAALGISDCDLKSLIEGVDLQRLSNNPRKFNQEELINLFK